jgi:aromatic ring-opening dioxygenase catalytic subunit (LigB family)
MTEFRMPVVFISHGGGPCFWIPAPPGFDPELTTRLAAYFGGIIPNLPARPKAILVVTAHWEAEQTSFAVNPHPGMLYDYYGFPKYTYELKFPAPGAPALAARATALLAKAGITAAADAARGYDHGVFVPLLKILPDADIPVLEMSILADYDPARHIALGAALAPLRDEGVLIIGSGLSYHNLRKFFSASGGAQAAAWDNWLTAAATQTDPDARNAALINWAQAPFAREAHPQEDHLLPLMVAAGAAGRDAGRRVYADVMGDKPVSGYAFG